MNRRDIFAGVARIVRSVLNLAIDQPVSEVSHFADDFGADDLELAEICLEVEGLLDIDLTDDDYMPTTVGDLVTSAERVLAAQAGAA